MATNNIHFDMWADDDREWNLGAQVPMSAPPIPHTQPKRQDHWSKGGNSVSPQRLRLEPIHEGRPHSYTQAIQDQDVVPTYERGVGRHPDSNHEDNEEDFIIKAHRIWKQGQFPDFYMSEETWEVWIMKPCLWFRFHSILFQSTQTGSYFTIEPSLEDGKLHVTTTYFDPRDPKYRAKGFLSIKMSPITITASHLFNLIAKNMRNFDQYSSENRRTCLLYCRQIGRTLKCIPPTPVYALVPEPAIQTWV